MFFNSKRFEIVDLTNQSILELNKVNTLSFYIKDVLLETEISLVSYLPLKKTGRDLTPIGSYVAVTDITGDIVKFDYTPTDSTVTPLTFRIRVVDTDDTEHVLYIDDYEVLA